MAKQKKTTKKGKSKRGRKSGNGRKKGLLGLPTQATENLKTTGIETLKLLGATTVGGVAGAAIGKPSLLISLPVIGYGVYKRQHFLTCLGLGMFLSNGFQGAPSSSSGTTPTAPAKPVAGFAGVDTKKLVGDAKGRVNNFIKSFSEKLYLPPKKTTGSVNGLSGNEPVTYFLNPYRDSGLDLSELDRIQMQIAEMNTPQQQVRGLEADYSEVNF